MSLTVSSRFVKNLSGAVELNSSALPLLADLVREADFLEKEALMAAYFAANFELDWPLAPLQPIIDIRVAFNLAFV